MVDVRTGNPNLPATKELEQASTALCEAMLAVMCVRSGGSLMFHLDSIAGVQNMGLHFRIDEKARMVHVFVKEEGGVN